MRAHSRSLTVVMFIAMASSTFALAAIAVLAADIIGEFGISREQLGLLVMAASLTGAALAPLLGPLADRVGARAATFFSFASSAAALLAMSISPSYAWLAFGALLAGIPQAVTNPATNMLILAHVPEGTRGVVTGIKQSGVQAGTAIGGLTLSPIALLAGWRWGVAVAVLVPLAGAALAWLVVPRDVRHRTTATSRKDRVPTGVTRLAVYGLFLGFGGTAISTYLPLFGQERLGLSPVVAGATVAVMGVCGVFGRIGWGRLVEARLAADVALLIVAGISVTVGLALVASPWLGPWVIWPVAVMTGVSAASWNSIGMLAIIQNVPKQATGRASGTVMLGFLTGLGLGAPLFGRSVDTFGDYGPGWMAVSVAFGAAFLLMIPAVRRRGRRLSDGPDQ